jgi:hypothetical protein
LEGVSPNTAPTALEFLKRAGTSTIGQRHHGADTGHRHQAPAHIIGPHDRQQAAVQDADLFAKYSPDNEQRLDQHDQVGEVLAGCQLRPLRA